MFFFLKFTGADCSYVFVFYKTFNVLTVRTTSDINSSLIFTWCERATVGKSLQVRSNFGCLTIAATKLI